MTTLLSSHETPDPALNPPQPMENITVAKPLRRRSSAGPLDDEPGAVRTGSATRDGAMIAAAAAAVPDGGDDGGHGPVVVNARREWSSRPAWLACGAALALLLFATTSRSPPGTATTAWPSLDSGHSPKSTTSVRSRRQEKANEILDLDVVTVDGENPDKERRKLSSSCLPIKVGTQSYSVCSKSTSKECEMGGGDGNGLCVRTGNRPQTFTYVGDGGPQNVLFKYGELVERATQYKLSIKDTAADHPVYLHFAIYKLALNLWTCVDPSRSTYGTVYGWGSGCTGSGDSKLIYKFVKAARAGVEVRIVYHNPNEIPERGDSSPTEDKIWDYLSNKVSSLPATFQIHRADWKEGRTYGQMHNKFLLVSHHKAPDGMMQVTSQTLTTPFSMRQITEYTHSTYVTSQNVDEFGSDSGSANTDLHLKSYVQNGVLVRGNEGLYNQYVKYFGALWNHTLPPAEVDGEEDANTADACTVTTCTRGYREKMQELHGDPDEPLNYEDGDVQAFFYPLPNVDHIWDTDYNAVAKYVNYMVGDSTNNMRYFKLNMYHFKSGVFLQHLLTALREVPLNKLHARIVYTTDSTDATLQGIRDLPPQGGSLAVRYHGGQDQLTHPYKSGEIRDWSPGSNKKSHTKNYCLYYNRNGSPEWVTITGSSNGKTDAYNRKANNQLVVIEREKFNGGNPPVYDAHKQAFYKSF